MDHQRQIIYLAALLHDIGKFYQRADDNGLRTSKILDREIKDLESAYCPVYNGIYSHKHVIWTAQFIADFEPIFKSLLGESFRDFFAAAVAHHKPDQTSLAQLVVQKADHYSSGVDRTKEEGQKDAAAERKWDDFKRVRMCSIFEGLMQQDSQYQFGLPIGEASLSGSSFPRKNADFTTSGEQEYKILWSSFEKEFKFLQADSFNTFAETLLGLLQKFTISVPSSTQHLPDVSLYDHLKSTAAIALCLHDYLAEKSKAKVDFDDAEAPLLLIGADFSGIQTFIYDIVGTDAAKNLKGRSFYLQLLADSVLQTILNGLELYQANVVYASGGGFYLLAPNTEKVKQKLDELTATIADKLFQAHQVSLYLAVERVAVTQGQVFNQRINEAWSELTKKLNLRKRQKFRKEINEDYSFFFNPSEVGGEQQRDVITNEEFSKKEWDSLKLSKSHRMIEYLDRDERSPQKPVKLPTYQQIQLGKTLKNAEYWVMSKDPIEYWDLEPFDPCEIGYYHYFIDAKTLLNYKSALKGSADSVRISRLNQLNFLESTISGKDNIYGFALYGGNDFPRDKHNEPLSFDELAGTGNEEVSLKRLGILRMDVDNLGQVFIRGFDEHKRTFSRYSTLSRNLDYFFKGYLNTIWETNPNFKQNTFILYAGGDDLFIVGKWNYLIEFARDIQKDFKKWTCQNPRLGLSGGIALVTGKFPIAKGASLSEEAEKLAKKYENSNHPAGKLEKNAFGLLGYALHWEHEYPKVEALKNQLVQLDKGGMPRSLLSKINGFYEQAQSQKKQGQNESWRWLIAYDFARAKDRLKDSDQKAFIDELKINVFTDSYQGQQLNSPYTFLELLNLAARWAELELRS